MKLNNILMILAIIVIGVALFNLGITINKVRDLTGYATSTGEANLTIESAASVNFSIDSINWGNGYVNTSFLNATLNTEGVMTGVDWNTITSGLLLENLGNTNVTVNLSSSKNSTDFIGGAGPSFKWKVVENETNSCQGATNITSYTDVTVATQLACDNLGYILTKNALEIDLELNISSDAIGAKGCIITATATALA